MSKVNRNEFADIVGYSPKWIGTFIDEGMPHEGGGGRGKPMIIDTAEAIKWLVDREVKKQLGDVEEEQNSPKAGTKDGEDLLLTKAKRRKAEVEAKKAEESVIDLPDVAQFLFAIATLYGNELNGLGARLAPGVASENEPAKCKHVIDVECRRVRAATADRLRGFVAEYRAKRGGHDASAADEERGGVGDE
ncbi:terminase small subunit [Enterovibrio norvegicus]|uniref:terminase small subunit n=1 Tax=Enterovibrio norvegicus TaxID=188144 RepID=UPI003554090F